MNIHSHFIHFLLLIFVLASFTSSHVSAASFQHKADREIATPDLAPSTETGDLEDSGDLPASVARFININPYGALLTGATFERGSGPNAGIFLRPSAVPAFAVGFTIPPDYIPGTALVVRILWTTPATGCTIELLPSFLSIGRAGRTHFRGPGVSSGLIPVGGSMLTAPVTATESAAKDYLVTSPDGASDLRPGDSVLLELFRDPGRATDTCRDHLVVQAISVLY